MVYRKMQSIMHREGDVTTTFGNFVCSGVAAATATLITQPADVVCPSLSHVPCCHIECRSGLGSSSEWERPVHSPRSRRSDKCWSPKASWASQWVHIATVSLLLLMQGREIRCGTEDDEADIADSIDMDIVRRNRTKDAPKHGVMSPSSQRHRIQNEATVFRSCSHARCAAMVRRDLASRSSSASLGNDTRRTLFFEWIVS